MEYTSDEYKRSVGRVYTTTDENKYIKSKIVVGHIYLKCVLFRSGCKVLVDWISRPIWLHHSNSLIPLN